MQQGTHRTLRLLGRFPQRLHRMLPALRFRLRLQRPQIGFTAEGDDNRNRFAGRQSRDSVLQLGSNFGSAGGGGEAEKEGRRRDR